MLLWHSEWILHHLHHFAIPAWSFLAEKSIDLWQMNKLTSIFWQLSPILSMVSATYHHISTKIHFLHLAMQSNWQTVSFGFGSQCILCHARLLAWNWQQNKPTWQLLAWQSCSSPLDANCVLVYYSHSKNSKNRAAQ